MGGAWQGGVWDEGGGWKPAHQPAHQHAPPSSPPQVVLGQALTSMLWLPQLHAWLPPPLCAEAVAAVADGVARALAAAEGGAHVPPSTMQEIQDAISVLYYLIQVRWP